MNSLNRRNFFPAGNRRARRTLKHANGARTERAGMLQNHFPTHPAAAEEMLAAVGAAARQDGAKAQAALEALPGPAYLTDAEGRITQFNQACIGFAGRIPAPGEDRWCVTWRLYREDGAFLPHEECPMAVAIRERRPIRGIAAIAESPDGTRRAFQPYPTPLFDDDGELVGALNLFAELGDATYLEAQAERCRRLAYALSDPHTIDTLTLLAADYESKAQGIHRAH